MNAPVLTRFLPIMIGGRVSTIRVKESSYQALIASIKKAARARRKQWRGLGKRGKVWKSGRWK